MATCTLQIDEKTKVGENLLLFLQSLSDVRLEKQPNETTQNAMKELKEGKGIKVDDLKKFFDGI